MGNSGQISVSDLLQALPELELELVAGGAGLSRNIVSIDVNRPGLALAGFYKNFAADRIQVFGKGECAYLADCSEEHRERIVREFFHYEFPALVFTHAHRPPDGLIAEAEATATPVFSTKLTTHNFISLFTRFIAEMLAPNTTMHGVFVEVFGVGILLTGPSGIGKSETALELVERGHRLVADDAVLIKCLGETDLYGYSSDLIEHHMELRGVGIINVKDLFGVGAIRNRKHLELLITLEDWKHDKEYERLGLEDDRIDILGVTLPRLVIPVRPGRNVPILIETAAMNQRSKRMGYNAARELSHRITKKMREKRDLQVGLP